ncbi:hypothetical protein GGG16DRAFT_59145 [Schizophyllum commune]
MQSTALDAATFEHADRFKKSGAKDLRALQISIATLYREQPLSSTSAAYRRVESLLQKGSALCLLDGKPPSLPLIRQSTSAHLDLLRAITTGLSIMSLLYKIAGRTNYELAPLLDAPPIPLPHILRWVDYIHPMHIGHVTLYPDLGTDYMIPLCGTLSGILTSERDYAIQFVRDYPRVVTLTLDLWLNYPRYFRGEESRCVLLPQMISQAMSSLLLVMYRDPSLKDILTAELDCCTEDRTAHRVVRCMAKQTRFLVRAPVPPEHRPHTWGTHATLLRNMATYPTVLGASASRSTFEAMIAGARSCLDDAGTSKGLSTTEQAGDAICALMLNAHNLRNTINAVRAGVASLIAELRTKLGPLTFVTRLEGAVLDSLWSRDVLRAMKKRHGRDMHTLRGTKLADRLSLQWRLYSSLRKEKAWVRTIPCHNVNSVSHTGRVKPCACGYAFYCSTLCQREHWYTTHYARCDYKKGGDMSSTGTLTLKDIVFLTESTQATIARHEREVVSQLFARMPYAHDEHPYLVVDLSSDQSRHTDVDPFGCRIRVEVTNNTRSEVVLPDHVKSVAVEIEFNVGRRKHARDLPFSYMVEGLAGPRREGHGVGRLAICSGA